MTQSLRRAAAYAVVASLSLLAPVIGRATAVPYAAAVPFAAVALGAVAITDGPLFDLFAYPRDRQEGRLETLAGFALAAAGLAILVPVLGLPIDVFVATLLVVGFGDLGRSLALELGGSRAVATVGFAVGGGVAGVLGQAGVRSLVGASPGTALPDAIFLAASAALLASLLRSVFVHRDDPLVLGSVALLLWLFADLAVQVTATRVGVALGLTVVFGYLSFAVGAASIQGMLTGVFLGLLAVVLGGYGWFAVLITFFAVGGLATKFRYGEKTERGVAEPNAGARGTGNVLGNSAAALLALLLFAASPRLPVSGAVFQYAFAGSVATALADTLSSEVGGLYDDPRLVTTLEPVAPGTDGAVTWQGELAGVGGAGLVAAVAIALLGIGPLAAGLVVVAGVAGMTVDSLAGATLEGDVVGNQAVNFLATATGGVVGALLAVLVGVA